MAGVCENFSLLNFLRIRATKKKKTKPSLPEGEKEDPLPIPPCRVYIIYLRLKRYTQAVNCNLSRWLQRAGSRSRRKESQKQVKEINCKRFLPPGPAFPLPLPGRSSMLIGG